MTYVMIRCEVYKQFESDERFAWQRYAQFAYEENKHLWGVRKTQAGRIASEEQKRMGELASKKHQHLKTCQTCTT